MANVTISDRIASVAEHKKCSLKCNIGDPNRRDMTCSYWDAAKAAFETGEVDEAYCPKFRLVRQVGTRVIAKHAVNIPVPGAVLEADSFWHYEIQGVVVGKFMYDHGYVDEETGAPAETAMLRLRLDDGSMDEIPEARALPL